MAKASVRSRLACEQLPDSGQRIYLPSPKATSNAPSSWTNKTSSHEVATAAVPAAPLRYVGGHCG
jgi:hypothetical protein